MTDTHGFPQDWATGLDEQVDFNDAGSYANHVDHPNLRDYVADGFEFVDIDWANNILRIGEGKAFGYETQTNTNDHRSDDGPDEKELLGGLFVIQSGPSGDITLVADDVNYVYVRLDQQNNDAVEFVTNTTQTAPPRPFVFIGAVDTANEEYYYANPAPVGTTQRHRVTGRVPELENL